jgi:hypothetical protein
MRSDQMKAYVIEAVSELLRARSCLRTVSAMLLASVFVVSSSFSVRDGSVTDRNSISNVAIQPVAGPSPADIQRDRKEETVSALALPSQMSRPAENTEPEAPQTTKPAEPEGVKPPEPGSKAVRPQVRRVDQVDEYLWMAYQRSSTKLDSHGDFTWKDVAAAARIDLSTQEYVIDGMDPDFRELLFHAGHAMDAAGIDWTILSAFRDDFRQGLARGYKAHDSNSFHGGTAATGGYGHGCAVDLASAGGDLSNPIVWNWLDQHGARFGLHRPLGRVDPAHVQPRGTWHETAAMLRNERTAGAEGTASSNVAISPGEPISAASADFSASISPEQFNCVRPPPPEDAGEPAKFFRRLVSRVAAPSAETKQAKAKKWRTVGGASIHRIKQRHPSAENVKRPADTAKHNAKPKGRIHLAG